jgi:hypothetical protein
MGWDAQHNAGEAANQAQAQKDWERQLWEQYYAPYAKAGLAQLPGQLENYNTMMGYLQNMMSGNTANLPSYLRPMDTSQLEQGLSTLSRQGLDRATQGMQGNIAQYYAQRGVPMSQQQTNLIPRFQHQFNNALATENANKATTMYGVNQANRADMLNNFYNMLGAVNGMAINPSQYAGQGMNMAGNNANYYNNLAQQYAQQSQGMMGGLGSILGTLWGGVGKSPSPGISTGGAMNNYSLGGAPINNTGMGMSNFKPNWGSSFSGFGG